MIVEKIKELIELEKDLARKELETKELNMKINEARSKITELMDAEQVTDIKVDGIDFKRTIEANFSIDSHDWTDKRFFDWLKENNMGDLIKVREDVHANTRKKVLKEWIEEGNTLPSFIKDSYFNTIKYRI